METPKVSSTSSRMLRSVRRAHLRAHINTTGCTAKPPSPDPDYDDCTSLDFRRREDSHQEVRSLQSGLAALSLDTGTGNGSGCGSSSGSSDTDPFKTPAVHRTSSTTAAAAAASLAVFETLPDEFSDESSALVCLLSNFENIYFDAVNDNEETSRSSR